MIVWVQFSIFTIYYNVWVQFTVLALGFHLMCNEETFRAVFLYPVPGKKSQENKTIKQDNKSKI